jgi:hypothetical protein
VTGYLIGAPPLTLSGSHRFTFFMRRKKDDTLLYLIGEYKEEEGAALLEIVFNPPFADTLIGVESLPDGRKIPVEEDADRRRVTLTEVSPVFALRLKRR